MPSPTAIKRLAARKKKELGIPHHAALDLAARQYGYVNWAHAQSELQLALRDEAQALAYIMAKHPELTNFGISYFRNVQNREIDVAKYRSDRKALSESVESFKNAALWLKNLPKTKNISRRITSYNLKHIIEADIGYITNGVCIAAAIYAGFKIQRMKDSPNVWFNISVLALKAEGVRIDLEKAHVQRLNDVVS